MSILQNFEDIFTRFKANVETFKDCLPTQTMANFTNPERAISGSVNKELFKNQDENHENELEKRNIRRHTC